MNGTKIEESKIEKIKIPCSNCGNESETKVGWHLRHNINFCSEKCVYDFIEEFMIMTFESVKKSEKKMKELENRINLAMKARRQKK
jgi:hypothetical protein